MHDYAKLKKLVADLSLDKEMLQERAAAALMAEVRKSFTINAMPIPPEIFRDWVMATWPTAGSIWVTVDVAAAVSSNLYYDEVTETDGWFAEKSRERGGEKTVYRCLVRPKTDRWL
jgi:hypothetical protein